jgi:membrane protease subunit (stomatin/prohibitin family)
MQEHFQPDDRMAVLVDNNLVKSLFARVGKYKIPFHIPVPK